MNKISILTVCAFGIQMVAKAQSQTVMPVVTATPAVAVEASKDASAMEQATPVQATEKKQCAGAAKSCSGAAATKSCCKAKTTTAAAPAAKSCCKDKAAASAAGCKGNEASAGGEKKSCAKPCCKKS